MSDLVDSGIFLRHLTQDHATHSPLATMVLDEIANGRREGYSTAATIAEVVYVIESPRQPYRATRKEIRDGLLGLIMLDHLHIDHKQLFPDILDLYVNTPADFVDCYHAALARALGLGKVITFDAHFRLFPFVAHGCP